MSENHTAMKTHLALNTDRFDDSVAFYRAFFGLDPVKLKPGYAKFDLANPPLNFTLNKNPVRSASPQGGSSAESVGALNHLGLQVSSTEEVDRAAERLRSTGLVTLEERDTDCCYALQDKIWVTDPNGNRWEVFVVKVADTDQPDVVSCESPASADERSEDVPGDQAKTECCEPGCCQVA